MRRRRRRELESSRVQRLKKFKAKTKALISLLPADSTGSKFTD
jgi:hypothetical protein